MGRPFAAVTAITLLLSAAPAAAAELTRVVSSGEKDNPFDLDLSVRWERTQRKATIAREYVDPAGGAGDPFATVQELQQLRLSETTNVVVPRVAVGLWEDLQLHAELPYFLSQETSWRLAAGVGTDVPDTISTNTTTPDGTACVGTCAIFPANGDQTVFHGGTTGDLKVGLSWAPFAEKRDDTKPTWVVGLEVTFPTAKLYDPAEGRNGFWDSPYAVASSVGPVGQKVWRYALTTAISKRVGPIDPYLRLALTRLQRSSGTYSNCDHAAELEAAGQGVTGMVARCAADPASGAARLPWFLGLTFGTELVPYDDAVAGQKIAFDLRLSADYTSRARWYNELTDATGKLLATQPYVTLAGRFGLVFRASEYVAVQASAALGWISQHDLTGEELATAATSASFDWRYDAPGRRFRATEATLFDLQVSGTLQF
ncbi:MAG: hypothetical protein NDI82_02800 [Anaeromyxobacteraceae bacterium]|nr:hypothetical protein [Anaeromyxobacteraceae bacterium]